MITLKMVEELAEEFNKKVISGKHIYIYLAYGKCQVLRVSGNGRVSDLLSRKEVSIFLKGMLSAY